jgi:hypothetical protein
MGHLWNIIWYIVYPEIFVGYNLIIMQHEIYGLSTKQQFHRDIENGTDNQQNDMWLYHAYLQMEGSLKCHGLGSDFSIQKNLYYL